MRFNINWRVDFDRLREDLLRDSHGAFFGGGFGGALAEAAEIENASDDELARIAERKGIDLRDYVVFSVGDNTYTDNDMDYGRRRNNYDEYEDYDSDDDYEDNDDYDSDDDYDDDEYVSDSYTAVFNKPFVKPTYKRPKILQIGTISVKVPDHMNYITKSELNGECSSVDELRSNYECVIASDDYDDSLVRHKDVPFGLNIDVSEKSELPEIWNAGKDKAKMALTDFVKQIGLTYHGKENPVSVVKQDDEFMILFSKGRESDDTKNYWISYFAVIAYGTLTYSCNIFINSKKNTKKNYEEAVREFLEKITPVSGKKKNEYEQQKSREKLGAFAGENGKIDAFKVALLYSEDVIFNNDDEIVEEDDKKVMTGLQVNADSPYADAMIQQIDNISAEIKQLSVFLENNKKLRIPEQKVDPEILKAAKNMPLSGLSVFELMAWHMIKLSALEENKYLAIVDRNLIKGIPGFYGYLGEIIKTLRKYNDLKGDFDVLATACINLDSPIENDVETPVKDADEYRSMYLFAIKEKIDSVKNGVSESELSLEDFGFGEFNPEEVDEDNLAIINEKENRSGSIALVEMQIGLLENSWENTIEESNNEIIGDKPFTRKNDARIKKLVSNTEKLIEETAETFGSYMEQLDIIGCDIDESDEKLLDVINLIGRCYDDLHMSYTVHTMEGMDQVVKYTIDKKYTNLSAKWKRKYNKLPTVLIPKLNEEIIDKKKNLTVIKRNITKLSKEKTDVEAWIEANDLRMIEEIAKADDEINQIKSQVEELNNQISELKTDVSDLREQKKNLKTELKEETVKLKEATDNYDSDLRYINTQIDDIENRMNLKSDERRNMVLEEQKQRQIAEKAFFFKKKKTEIADEWLSKIQTIDYEIKKLEGDLELYRENYRRTEENAKEKVDRQKMVVDEAEKELHGVEESIAANEKKLEELKNEKTQLDSKSKDISAGIKDMKSELTENKNRKKELDKEIKDLESQRDGLETEIQERNDNIAEIKKKQDKETNLSSNSKKSKKLKKASTLEEQIIKGLQKDSEDIYNCFMLIANKLKIKEFKCSPREEFQHESIDELTDYIYSIDGIDPGAVSYRYTSFSNDFELIYYPKYVKPVDLTMWLFPFDYYVCVTLFDNDGSFDLNHLVKRIIDKVNELDKNMIFNKLIEDAEKAINEGKELKITE